MRCLYKDLDTKVVIFEDNSSGVVSFCVGI